MLGIYKASVNKVSVDSTAANLFRRRPLSLAREGSPSDVPGNLFPKTGKDSCFCQKLDRPSRNPNGLVNVYIVEARKTDGVYER